MNLLSNSYKFTAKGSVIVKAKTDHEDAQSVRVTCSVADTGIGITQEQAMRLFKPFSQADSSTQRSYGGSGLGLSICKALVQVFNGKIWLESQLGRGTTVYFTLNFPKTISTPTSDKNTSVTQKPDLMATWSSDESQDGYEATAPLFDLSRVPRNDLRICVAEDNPINQKIAVSFVTKLGFQCEAYSDGLQAVEALRAASARKDPFHLCLMDVQMPVLDGYDATRLIRKDDDPTVRSIVVVAMTASAIRGDREKCLHAGMNNYLAKPVRIAVLKSMLEDIISHPTKSMPSPQQTANAVVKDALEQAKQKDEANDVALKRASFGKRMSSRNDIHVREGAGEVTPSPLAQGSRDDQIADQLRPTLSRTESSREKSDETITPATSFSRAKTANVDGSNATNSAVPPLVDDLANSGKLSG